MGTRREERLPDETSEPIDEFSIRREIEVLFKTSEASRAVPLHTKKGDTYVLYLLGLEPLTPQGVKQLREKLALIERKIGVGRNQQLDNWIEQTIRLYDPFGAGGKRIIGIRIPHDPNQPMGGWTHDALDFDQEIDRIHTGQGPVPTGFSAYGADDDGRMRRFDHLIVGEK